MKVVTAEQMRALDGRAIQEFGIPGAVLMENAGRSVVEVMAREYGPLAGKRVLICCGSGNNGGDGFVVARYLRLAGALPQIVLVGDPVGLKDDARAHFHVARQIGIPMREPSELGAGQASWAEVDLIVDALLGTGLKDAPRQSYADAIRAINAADWPIVAVDLPSGLDSDTGATPGAVVRATHTVTFAYPKIGMYLYPGAEYVGKLHVSDIGFDWEVLQAQTSCRLFEFPTTTPYGPVVEERALPASKMGLGTAAKLLQKRAPDSNKGDYGHVAVVGGSLGMVGAPSMVARAAQRCGAGLVTVLAPACAQPAIAGKLDEQMTLPLPDADGAASPAAFDTIRSFAEKATVVCVGPGMTTQPGAVALVQRLLAEIHRPIVLDADGLNALAQQPDCLSARPDDPRAPLILTPHPGEAARLLGTDIADVQSDRMKAVRELARRYHAVVLLKGRYTLVADPSGEVVINTSGNPGMASGGMGDALTGVIGGLLSQGLAPGRDVKDIEAYRAATVRPEDATALGAYLHGLAGDLAAAQNGEAGLTTGDLIAQLPHALRQLTT